MDITSKKPMDKHFITLRKKLSILATLVVFLITILVGVGFISYQYWREYRFVLGKSISYQTEVTNLSIRESDLETFKDNPAYA